MEPADIRYGMNIEGRSVVEISNCIHLIHGFQLMIYEDTSHDFSESFEESYSAKQNNLTTCIESWHLRCLRVPGGSQRNLLV